MTIHAMDILADQAATAICLVSSDADFTPLAQRIRAGGRTLLRLGHAKAAATLALSADAFCILPDLVKPAPPTVRPAPPPIDPMPEQLRQALTRIAAASGTDGWLSLPIAAGELHRCAPDLAKSICIKGKFLKTLRASGVVSEKGAGSALLIKVKAG